MLGCHCYICDVGISQWKWHKIWLLIWFEKLELQDWHTSEWKCFQTVVWSDLQNLLRIRQKSDLSLEVLVSLLSILFPQIKHRPQEDGHSHWPDQEFWFFHINYSTSHHAHVCNLLLCGTVYLIIFQLVKRLLENLQSNVDISKSCLLHAANS